MNDQLGESINLAEHQQSKLVSRLWKHNTRPIQFMLGFDDFGVMYTSCNDANHPINSPKQYYDIFVDDAGKEWIKTIPDWDYDNNKVHLSMNPSTKRHSHDSTTLYPLPNK